MTIELYKSILLIIGATLGVIALTEQSYIYLRAQQNLFFASRSHYIGEDFNSSIPNHDISPRLHTYDIKLKSKNHSSRPETSVLHMTGTHQGTVSELLEDHVYIENFNLSSEVKKK